MPAHKRKQTEDEFVYTLSDKDEYDDEDAEPSEPVDVSARPAKKIRSLKPEVTRSKADSSRASREKSSRIRGEVDSVPWMSGQEEDTGVMDSDFEFFTNDNDIGDEVSFEGWGFESVKNSISVNKKSVDIDEILERRRSKNTNSTAEPAGNLPVDQETTGDSDEHVGMDDEVDEVLADDAFGMQAQQSDDNTTDTEAEQEPEVDEEAASDLDSVATPVSHPDDAISDDSDEEDLEEQAKRDAFFAPEEKQKVNEKTNFQSFMTLCLSRPILKGLAAVGFSKPTPIQSKTIPIALMGKDVVGGAVTGSGKTGAFMIPILERLLYRPTKVAMTRVVILTPTRELAMQCHAVAVKLASHTDIKFSLAVGGLSLKVQEAELRRRPDVVIATPGRFIDHMRNSASFNVDTVEILVLDEADRMLEDGFADELNEILTTLPKSRQTMLFSATMTSTVDRLIRLGMNRPARLLVDAKKKTVGTLTQEFIRLRPGREEKRMGYLVHLCRTLYTERVIVFFRQKKEAHRARIVFGLLGLSCGELHGSMSQAQRIESVEAFRDGKVSFLLATDLASRGLDIKGIDTVINYEAPQSLEIYVHRVGRTARAGREGRAVTLAAENDRKVVKAAVKAGKSQGAKIVTRVIAPADADRWQDQIDKMEPEINEVMQEEREEKQLAHAEMEVRKGENLIKHEADIKSRPRRTWFETQHEKTKAKKAGQEELNGMRESLKKSGGKLSNKDKKRLDAKAARSEGALWKKGKTDKSKRGAKKGKKKPASRGKQ